MKIAVTGHRPNKIGNEYDGTGPKSDHIRKELIAVIKKYKPDTMISGMALGVDTIWAVLAVAFKIPLTAAIPFRGQHLHWPDKAKNLYSNILDSPLVTTVIVSEGGYSPHKMQVRNEWMVNNCDILVAVWNGSSGGTKNCYDYAHNISKPIIRIHI